MLLRNQHVDRMQTWTWRAALLVACSLTWSTAAEISTFRAGDGGWHLGTLTVGNLDSEPDLEIVIPYRNSSGQWVLDAFKYNGQRLPGFPYNAGGQEMNVSPTLFDLDGDGRDEILFTRGNQVIAMRSNGSILWSNFVAAENYVPNGGFQTITNGFYWSNGGGFISRLPSTAVFSSQVSPPIVVDINGDGTREVVTGWKIDPDSTSDAQDFSPFINDIFGSGEWGTMGESWSGGVVLFDALNGSHTFTYHIQQLVESGLAVGQADRDRAQEIYVLNDSDSIVCFDKTKPHGLWGEGMLHKQFGKNQQLMSGCYQLANDIYTADLDGDGLDEVLVAGTQLGTDWEPNETILDDDGTLLWRQWRAPTNYMHVWGWRNSSCLIPVNPDHDNRIDVLGFTHGFEITFRTWNGIEMVDRPGWPKNFYPYFPSPPVVGDVDGDGQEEIIIGTYNPLNNPSDGNLLIYALDGRLKTSVPVPGGLKHIPTLADVNHDGSLDVIYRSLVGQVYVQNFGANSADRVSWATHRGNSHHDGNRGKSLFPPGTPMLLQKTSGYRRASFSWTPMPEAQGYRILRAAQANGPFVPVLTLTTNCTTYTDQGLVSGWQYFYEVGAIYSTNTVYSSPFAVLSFANSNLVSNAGFEENDNSHWDKWFTGDIELTNMLGNTNVVFQGRQSMQIRLNNKGNNGTIAQYCQYGIPESSIRVAPGQLYSFGGFIKSGGLSQPSEHWFEWASGKTAYNTNTRPALPYPNYFTPHFVLGAQPSQWMYLNRTFIMPTGFPNIDLRHRYSVSAPASGSVFLDNVFFRTLPLPNATNWSTWIPFGSTWKYFTQTPPANWFTPSFDDRSWAQGTAKLGAGSGPKDLVTILPQNRPSYYFRKSFVPQTGQAEELLLSATCTDDYGGTLAPLRIWLNGVELVSSGIETVTGQGNEVRYFDLLPFVDRLVPGTNTIAVQLGNIYQSTWDDVAFDVSLKAVVRQVPATTLTLRTAATDLSLCAQIPSGSIWQLQSTDQLPLQWQTLSLFTNTTTTGTILPLMQVPQNGSLQSATPHRFYRLVPW